MSSYFTKVIFPIALLTAGALSIQGCSELDGDANTIIKGSNTSLTTKALAPSGSPTSIKVKFYGLAVSKNTDCTDAEVIFDNSLAPETHDLTTSPTLFAANLADGTYQCVIMRISDNIKYRVDQKAVDNQGPGCADTTTEYTHDIYRSGSSGWKDMEGQDITARGTQAIPVEDIVEIVASTTPGDVTKYHGDQVTTLGAPLVIPGTSIFYADFNDGIENDFDGTDNYCVLEDGGFGFR